MRFLRAEAAAAVFALAPFLCVVACGESFKAGENDSAARDGVDASSNEQIDGGDGNGGSGGVSSGGGAGSGNVGASNGGRSTGGGSTGGGAGASAGGRGGATSGGRGGTSAGGMHTSGGVAGSGTGGTVNADAGPDPVTITTNGMVAWFRADMGITLTKGSLVSRWADQSARRSDATQDLEDTLPVFVKDGINGHPAVEFDGKDDNLQIGASFPVLSESVTMFAVVQAGDPTLCTAIFETSNGSEVDDISLGSYQGKVNFEILNDWDQGMVLAKDTPQLIAAVDRTDGTYQTDRNGAYTSSGNIASPASVPRQATFIGKTLYTDCPSFLGKIGEIIVYDRALETAEIGAVNAYLQTKFGCCSR